MDHSQVHRSVNPSHSEIITTLAPLGILASGAILHLLGLYLTIAEFLASREKKEQVDRSQLIISDEESAVLGSLPGQLNGKQFLVRNCKNCTILVLDYTETVTIEKCADCHYTHRIMQRKVSLLYASV